MYYEDCLQSMHDPREFQIIRIWNSSCDKEDINITDSRNITILVIIKVLILLTQEVTQNRVMGMRKIYCLEISCSRTYYLIA